jgi:cyclohexanecarboxylate-CoA ligase
VGAAALLPQSRIDFARSGGWWRDETVLDCLDRNLARRPERVAVVDYNSMTRRRSALTYAELDRRVTRIAAGLARRGVGSGDVVSGQLPNWWEAVALHLAAMRIGAIVNPLMPIFRERELGFMLGLAESKVLVAPERFRDFDHVRMIEALRPGLPALEHVLIVGANGDGSFEAMLEEPAGDCAALFTERRPSPDALVQILYTSGTTGEPKGVMHTSNTLFANLEQFARLQRLDASDVTLMSSPLAHQTGFLYGIMNPLLIGGKVVLQDVWKPAEAVELIAREGVTFSIGSTPFLSDLTDAAEGRREDFRSLRMFVAAGAPIPRALVRRASENLGAEICSMWGMTENGPAAFTRLGDPPERTFETDGCAVPGMELRIVDDVGRPAAAGVEGRLVVRGAGMFVGYLKRPEWRAADADGWFDTGDLGRMDGDGYLRITGRSKDVIIRGGENVPVVEIENLMYRHPAVAEVAIVPMPDPRLNERACAFVVLRPGSSLTLRELTAYLAERKCAKNYMPERLELVEAMPRTASGKIQKFRLREIAKRLAAGVT